MEQGSRFTGNLGVGAMSNNFGLDASVPKTSDGLVKDYWEGDNLAKTNLYDGLNVPDTGNQAAPSHGRCFNAGGRATRFAGDPTPHGASPLLCRAVQRLLAGQPGHAWCRATRSPAARAWARPTGTCRRRAMRPFPQRFEPVGSFTNNRAHGCFDGLFGETDIAAVTQQLFPTVDGKTTSDLSSVNLIGHFNGFTATRIRNRGVWMRPVWTALETGRFATNRDSVSLVSSGGIDGNAPGVWALLKDSVLVGVSRNNVDRWGPCPAPAPGEGPGCVDCNQKANDFRAGLPDAALEFGRLHDLRRAGAHHPRPLRQLPAGPDAAADPRRPGTILKTSRSSPTLGHQAYEGDAALGWFQSNQSAYPTATVSATLSFDNVDLRHQIYTDK